MARRPRPPSHKNRPALAVFRSSWSSKASRSTRLACAKRLFTGRVKVASPKSASAATTPECQHDTLSLAPCSFLFLSPSLCRCLCLSLALSPPSFLLAFFMCFVAYLFQVVLLVVHGTCVFHEDMLHCCFIYSCLRCFRPAFCPFMYVFVSVCFFSLCLPSLLSVSIMCWLCHKLLRSQMLIPFSFLPSVVSSVLPSFLYFYCYVLFSLFVSLFLSLFLCLSFFLSSFLSFFTYSFLSFFLSFPSLLSFPFLPFLPFSFLPWPFFLSLFLSSFLGLSFFLYFFLPSLAFLSLFLSSFLSLSFFISFFLSCFLS